MIGGSIDMLATGAVISNFPARGQGKMFLVNDVEFATAQLWVREDQGIKTLRRPEGQEDLDDHRHHRARVPRHGAARQQRRSDKDVEVVNQRMAEAVTSFISGAVPAVALWVPFNIPVRDKVPGAKMLIDASAYYPKAAIVGGWAARNDYYEQEPRGLRERHPRLGRGERLDHRQLRRGARRAAEEPLPAGAAADLKEQFKAQKMFTSTDWKKLYADGTVTKWLQQVTDFFVQLRRHPEPGAGVASTSTRSSTSRRCQADRRPACRARRTASTT